MTVGNRSHPRDDNPNIGICLAECIHQIQIVCHKGITIVGPVTRVGVIDSQMDDHNISCKIQCFAVFFLSCIWTVSLIEQGGAGLPEVFNFIMLSQQFL